ncbi:MAG: ferritin-like domain-containing protein [Acidimicrobiales bacterium]
MRKKPSTARPAENRRHEVLAITEAELLQLTSDLDEMHHATLPALREAVDEWADELRAGGAALARTRTSRRRFLAGGGAALGALALVACGTDDDVPVGGNPTPTDPPGTYRPLSGDFAVAGLAAALENLAVNSYQAGLDAATAGKLGAVPPAVATFATTAKAQHADHAAAWNSVLTNGGRKAITGVDQTVKTEVVDPGFAQVTDVAGLARFALGLENLAAATYLNDIAVLENNNALKIAASIQPVEMQHAAILNFVLGQYPVPDAFAKTDGARPPTDVIW